MVGEVRGGESLDMLQAMNTGHEGSLSTVHANSPGMRSSRLETLVLMAGMDLPLRAIREQAASAIDVIVQLSRLRDGTRRIVSVTEVQGMEGQTVTLQDAFAFDYAAGVDEAGRFRGQPVSTGVRPRFTERFEELGITVPARIFRQPADGGLPRSATCGRCWGCARWRSGWWPTGHLAELPSWRCRGAGRGPRPRSSVADPGRRMRRPGWSTGC